MASGIPSLPQRGGRPVDAARFGLGVTCTLRCNLVPVPLPSGGPCFRARASYVMPCYFAFVQPRLELFELCSSQVSSGCTIASSNSPRLEEIDVIVVPETRKEITRYGVTHRCRWLFCYRKWKAKCKVAARHAARATKRSTSRAGDPSDGSGWTPFSAWIGRNANRPRTEDTCEAEKALYKYSSVDPCCMYPCVKRSVPWVEVRVAATVGYHGAASLAWPASD
ncbi:uncharacterized protein MKK02DRAFT_27976 [Dioszegia hungarica]|uniref:Uncharacterized protein n=1 Tax=Dioszegia hungarica TaxID=4972 RepID=A0AA38H902_9TREE|nr:uncharacterized protein MKK02DRAFT_27976 [Dioszegia hungarica]KAI9634841.1 hypothetical protein MKK02DRAFT_27976 [Dioszegia hungarica]